MPVMKVPHPDPFVEGEGWPAFLDEEFDPDPAAFRRDSGHAGHERPCGSRATLLRHHVESMDDTHRRAAPSGIAAKERHEADGLTVAFGNQTRERCPLTSWLFPDLIRDQFRPSRREERGAFRIGITGTRPVMTSRGIQTEKRVGIIGRRPLHENRGCRHIDCSARAPLNAPRPSSAPPGLRPRAGP